MNLPLEKESLSEIPAGICYIISNALSPQWESQLLFFSFNMPYLKAHMKNVMLLFNTTYNLTSSLTV